LLAVIDQVCTADARLEPACSDVRVRHLVKDGEHFYMLFNESGRPVKTNLSVAEIGIRSWIDTATGDVTSVTTDELDLNLSAYELALLHVARSLGVQTEPRIR
jgi:hypothetical protein